MYNLCEIFKEHFMIPYDSVLFHIIPDYSILFHMIPYYSILFHIIPYDSLLFPIIPYCIDIHNLGSDTSYVICLISVKIFKEHFIIPYDSL